MKYADIIKLTPWGSYRTDMSITSLVDWIKRNEQEKPPMSSLQLNPDFQRGHVWNEQQQLEYIEFLLRGGKTNPFLFNHPGWMRNFRGEFVLVDGLQRITSIQKFLNNEIAVFGGNHYDDFEDKELICRRIDVQIFVNSLKTRKEVLQWYVELNSAGVAHSTEEINRVKELIAKEK